MLKKLEIPKDRLFDLYCNKKMSLPQIAKLLNASSSGIRKNLIRYNIPLRSIKEALTGKPKSLEHRRKLSESTKGPKHYKFGKKCPHSGVRCWYTCPDGKVVSMRSQWEVWYAEYLKEKGINFQYEPKTFVLSNGRAYTPDFLLENGDFVEVKGWLTPEHKNTIHNFRSENPQINLILADRQYLCNLGINLRRKWVAAKPKFPCEFCKEEYPRSYPQQRFCSIKCRNSYIANNKGKEMSVTQKSSKRKYNGNQKGTMNNGCAVSDEGVVKVVRTLHMQGLNNSEISRKLNLTPGNVSNIVRGVSWKEII